jgi:hypothetical protein
MEKNIVHGAFEMELIGWIIIAAIAVYIWILPHDPSEEELEEAQRGPTHDEAWAGFYKDIGK